jgi:hypothetical protein
MTVAAIMSAIAILQPFLAGTALSGVLAIATPTRIRGILFALKVITGGANPAAIAAKLVTAPVKGAVAVAKGDHLSESEKVFFQEYRKSHPVSTHPSASYR